MLFLFEAFEKNTYSRTGHKAQGSNNLLHTDRPLARQHGSALLLQKRKVPSDPDLFGILPILA